MDDDDRHPNLAVPSDHARSILGGVRGYPRGDAGRVRASSSEFLAGKTGRNPEAPWPREQSTTQRQAPLYWGTSLFDLTSRDVKRKTSLGRWATEGGS